MVWIIVSITFFFVGGVSMYMFSDIGETNIGKWFLVNGLACIVAGLIVLYVVLW